MYTGRKLTRVFDLSCLIFRQRKRGDHHGDVGQDQKDVLPGRVVPVGDSAADGVVAQHHQEMACGAASGGAQVPSARSNGEAGGI